MPERARTGEMLFCDVALEGEELDAAVNGVFINDLHIVEMRLAHLYGVKSGQTAELFDVVIAPAAEMLCAAVFCEKLTVIWHCEFLV